MINGLENAQLLSDLDCGSFDLLNVGSLLPVPLNLVATNDARLHDARSPLDGSVTNASVASGAGIVQSKLTLDGMIPTAWLGNTSTTAAQGDLAEYIPHKGQPGGYASLDGTGKVPADQLPSDAGTGTATSVGLTMPGEFGVTSSPVTTSGTIAVAWNNEAAYSWFGNETGSSAVPHFITAPLPAALLTDLPASKVTTGVFVPALLPIAVGVGGSHAPGAVPDPGASGGTTDYLARNMTYQPLPAVIPTYQPTVPDPILTAGYPAYEGTLYSVFESLTGVSLFYALTSPFIVLYVWQELPETNYVIVPSGQVLHVYGAKAGYNNSNIVHT